MTIIESSPNKYIQCTIFEIGKHDIINAYTVFYNILTILVEKFLVFIVEYYLLINVFFSLSQN